MDQHGFESRVLAMWTKTRVPMTRANLLAYTGAPRPKIEKWLDEMVRASLLEVDSDDEGEILWRVRGAARPSRGAESIAEVDRIQKLESDVTALTATAGLASRAAGLTAPASGKPTKSIVASGALSFFFGPLGWLYAAPLGEAVPAAIGYVILCAILPSFLLGYVLGLVGVASGLAGALYAWSYNRAGKRQPLFGKERDPLLLPRKR